MLGSPAWAKTSVSRILSCHFIPSSFLRCVMWKWLSFAAWRPKTVQVSEPCRSMIITAARYTLILVSSVMPRWFHTLLLSLLKAEFALATQWEYLCFHLLQYVLCMLSWWPAAWSNIMSSDFFKLTINVMYILQLTTLPLTCPRADLHVYLSGSSVTMCNCKNVWLKALIGGKHGSVNMDPGAYTCGDAITTDEHLRKQCQHPDIGRY